MHVQRVFLTCKAARVIEIGVGMGGSPRKRKMDEWDVSEIDESARLGHRSWGGY